MTDQPPNWAAPGGPPPGWTPPPAQGGPGWAPPGPAYGAGPAYGPGPAYGAGPAYGPGEGPPPGWGPPGLPPPGAGFAPRPGIIPLRPLGLGEILDGALTYIRRNPAATLGLSAVVAVLTQGIVLVLQLLLIGTAAGTVGSDLDPEGLLGAAIGGGIIGLVGGLVSLVATAAVTGMLIVVLGEAVLGRTISLGDAWRRVRGRVPGIVGLSLLITLAVLAVLGVAVTPGILSLVAGADGLGGALIGVGVLIALPLAIWLGIAWTLATPAYTLENLGVVAAMRRSFGLVRTQWWRVFGILLLGTIIASVVAGILTVPFSGVAGLLAGDDPLNPVIFILPAIGGVIATTLTTPFSAGITGLLYVDQRIRKEAFDLQLGRAAGLQP